MNNKKAFTIIEVVLVLAVAGLIFLVVFAAIPRLQASRRDNQRKRDLEAIYALTIEYESNTGQVPTGAGFDDAFPADPGTTQPSGAFAPYITDDAGDNMFIDPSSGEQYVWNNGNASTMSTGMIRMRAGANGSMCVTAGLADASPADTSKYAWILKLERGHICLDNQ